VVDNGSKDGTVDWLKSQDVTLIENGQNLGYSYAHNQIWDYTYRDDNDKDTLLLLLSNDMLPLPNALDSLIKASIEHPEIPIISGDTIPTPAYCAYYPQDRHFFSGGDKISLNCIGYDKWSAGWMYNLNESTADEFVASMFANLVPTLPKEDILTPIEGNWFPPGHRVYRKLYFDKIGYFDANFYPVYSTDFDVALRARKTDIKLYVIPSSICLEFWSRVLYEGIEKIHDIRRDDYYREKWGPNAAGAEGWDLPFNGLPQPVKFAGYDSSKVKIDSREGELDRVKQLMGSKWRGGCDPTVARSLDRKHTPGDWV